ncbi:filamentous hemagglutinin N-terminal domain-containing protein [Tolypothrix campylonemoides VB511288]|nr:filamentous hemagglutinin N-terminal domain-containing protein [Tolypothrix campylonemoides VB511288]
MFAISTRWAWFIGIATAFWTNCASAQIVPDATLPNNSTVNINGNIFNITGGTTAGGNLFHSFKDFSVPTGGEAFFDAVNIQNIISRVTGGSISNIDGLIRTLGTANLFLINPNGIVFGPNASLNIGGSFVASTANSLRFADGREFSATNPQAPPLLTVSVPLGLQFGSNPGKIVNQSQAAVDSSGYAAGLQVFPGKTLALVGGNVSLEGGNLTGGRIELGSVGTGLVNLTEIPQGYALEYSGVQNFQDIQLSNGAQVVTIGEIGGTGGTIQVQGRNINLTGNAQIYSATLGGGTGGNLTVKAAESVNLGGDNTGLATQTEGTGSAGDLTITTRKLTVDSGAFIATFNFGQGQAGDLLVRASDAVELSGTTTDGQFPSGLFAQVQRNATGEGGNLRIETGRLTIRDGAQVRGRSLGKGNVGDVTIVANGISLNGVNSSISNTLGATEAPIINVTVNNEGIPQVSSVQPRQRTVVPEATGNSGDINIRTRSLSVTNGARLNTSTSGQGNAGNINIDSGSAVFSGTGLTLPRL